MKIQSKFLLTGYSLTLCLALLGCGGGDTSTTPTINTESTYTVSGTVPGTLIEAFCKDGSYYRVNSTDDGTSNHPFTLEIPASIDCKCIMTTNEKDVDTSKHIVTPLLFNNGTTTSSYFQLSDNMELGYIPLSLSGTGVQTPLIINIENSQVQLNTFAYDPLDIDNDGVPNVYEDNDNDGIYNIDDEDNNTATATDLDGDGIENIYDTDDDNDQIKDSEDTDNDSDTSTTTSTTSTPVDLPITYQENAGRLLGSQCAQCHGTNGNSVNSWDSIAGESNLESEIFEDDEAIMSAQAHGYTSEEITLMGNWLKTLSKNED